MAQSNRLNSNQIKSIRMTADDVRQFVAWVEANFGRAEAINVKQLITVNASLVGDKPAAYNAMCDWGYEFPRNN